jgi:pimeloyl-ACP methyl ester carboxylesterase
VNDPRVEQLSIPTSDGLLLDGTLTRAGDSGRGIVLCHGMTVARDDEGILVRAEPLLNALGYATLRFDFRGHGRSQGEPLRHFTVSGELADLESAVRLMEERGIVVTGLVGASFGGAIAALYVGQYRHQVEMLLLANPLLSFRSSFLHPDTSWGRSNFLDFESQLQAKGFVEVGGTDFKIGPAFFEEAARYDPAAELGKYRGSLMVVHGDRDSKISHLHSRECFAALPNPNKRLRIVEGAEHGFHDEPYESLVTGMIGEYFRGGAASGKG